MAVKVQSSGTVTIRGISYTLGSSKFTCQIDASGNAKSEGGGSTTSAARGDTFTLYKYATGTTVQYPYAIKDTYGNVRGWFKVSIFPRATYSVSYSANGGSGAPPAQTKSYNIESTLSRTRPTRTGYTFLGWSMSKTATSASYSAGGTIPASTNQNVILYAVWKADPCTYNIVYKASSGAQLETATITKNFGTSNTISPKSFVGYASPSSQTVTWDSTSAKTITFTYTPYKLTVYSYSNYATSGTLRGKPLSVNGDQNVLVQTSVHAYNQSNPLSSIQNSDHLFLIRLGYTPTGYWITPDGKHKSYQNQNISGQDIATQLGVDISNGDKSVNVYVEWQANKLTVNYYSNYATAGKLENTPLSVNKDSNVRVYTNEYTYDKEDVNGLPDVQNNDYLYLERDGYVSTGYWGTALNGGDLVHQHTAYTGKTLAEALGTSLNNANASINVYAQWKLDVVKIYVTQADGTRVRGSLYVRNSSNKFVPVKELYKQEDGDFRKIL